MIKSILLLVSILPYPLRRDLRTNFYRYYFKAAYEFRSNHIDVAEETAQLAYNSARNHNEAFLSLYLLGAIKSAKGEWQRAQNALENALSLAKSLKDSVLIEPWLLYVYFYNDGLYASYQLAKSFNTNIPEERVFKGLYLIEEERYDDGLVILRGLKGNTVDYMRSFIFYKKGMLDSALYYISKITTLNNVERLFYATLLYKNGDFKKSHEIVKTVEKNDVYSVLLQILVENQLKSKELIKTYKKFKDILVSTPSFGAVSLMVAKMYFSQKKYNRVVDILDEGIPYMDTSSKKESLFYLGMSYIYLKRYASAFKTWEEYLNYKDDTHYDFAHFQLGRSAYMLELDSIAKEHFIRLHDTSALYFWALYLYSRILLKAKSYKLAMPLLSYIANFNIERSLQRRVFYYLGKISINERNWDSAITYFKKVLSLGFKGMDIDTAEYLYEYAKLQKGMYASPIELNVSFSEKYPENHMVSSLLDEVLTYYMTKGKADSAYDVLLKRRKISTDSTYMSEFNAFLDMLTLKDTVCVHALVDFIEKNGTDFERIELGNKLIEMGMYDVAIDILKDIASKNNRRALFLVAKAYKNMGKTDESNLVLKEVFPPYDSLGMQSFGELALSVLLEQGIDTFYKLVFNKDVPDSLRAKILRRASLKLMQRGDTLSALELKSRLREIIGEQDTLEEH